eukprot:IDg17325t1
MAPRLSKIPCMCSSAMPHPAHAISVAGFTGSSSSTRGSVAALSANASSMGSLELSCLVPGDINTKAISKDPLAWLDVPLDLSFPKARQCGSEHSKRYACKSCGLRFRERKNLAAHTDEVHRKRRRYACAHSRCSVVSNRRYNMTRHVRLMHARPCRSTCAACAPPGWPEVCSLADIAEVSALFDALL